MIIGAHAILYSRDAEADRGFLRDVLHFPSVDAGDGWLIFRLPPAEVAVHPASGHDRHELFLMTDDVEALVSSLRAQGVATTRISDQGWGRLTQVTLPGGSTLGIYQPRHATPPPFAPRPSSERGARPATRKAPAKPGSGSGSRRPPPRRKA